MVKEKAGLSVALVLLAACTPGGKTSEPAAPVRISVKVATPHLVREMRSVAVSGSVVSPENPSNLAFLVSGKIVRVGPREGETVQAGQVLATIDSTDYSLAVSAAAAQVAGARALLQKAESPARPEILEQARIYFERATDELRRMRMLRDSKSLPENDFQKVQAAFESASQQYQQAKSGAQKEDQAQARAALDQAIITQRMAQKRLDDATLRAPAAGYIASRSIELGDMATPGRPVFQVVQIDPVEVNVGVPETDMQAVRIGQPAIITAPALPGQEFQGTVRVINVAADPATRTYMARIRVPNPKRILKLGMVAEASIRGTATVDILTISTQAIVRDLQGAPAIFVYDPSTGRVHSRRIELGTLRGDCIEIKSGVRAEEAIVVTGQSQMRDGIVVNAQTAGAAEGK